MLLGVIEHDRGHLEPMSLQMLTFARELGQRMGVDVEAVVVGEQGQLLAEAVHPYGVAKVHLAQHPQIDDYAPRAWGKALAGLVESIQPDAVLAAGTERGNEIMAHLAAHTRQPMSANTVLVEPGPCYEVTRLRWGSSLWERATLKGEPKLLTLAPHTVQAAPAPAPGELQIVPFHPTIDDRDLRARVTRREEVSDEGLTLNNAPIVIGGGRGVGSAEGFAVLEDLAALLGGVVGGSRVATNNGWRPHSDQVGLTGNRISPDLYIACGISGAIQHLVGCKGAKRIMVINKDPEAPFFAKADYGVVGDVHEIVPAVIEEIRKQQTST